MPRTKKTATKAQLKRYFEVNPILKQYPKARYYFLLGARSCGKTYPTLKHCLEEYFKGNGVFVYIRRYDKYITESKLRDLMAGLIKNDIISKLSDGRWNRIKYWQRRWFLERWEQNEETGIWERVERNPQPVGIAVALNTWEGDKGGDFGADKGGISTIILDETLSEKGDYLENEWSAFQNVISTFIRDRWEKDTKIFLLSNPLSKYGGPYLRNIGIKKQMIKQFGTYEIIYPNEQGQRNKNCMSTIFCYIAAKTDAKGNTISIDDTATQVYNKFFAFENSKGKSLSVTHGYWELEDAAALPSGVYKNSTKSFCLWIHFGEELLCIDFMRYDPSGVYYCFIHPSKRIPKNEYFVTLDMTLDKYGIIGLDTGHPCTKLLGEIWQEKQFYYSDLETADIWHGFCKECKQRKV